MRAILTKFCPFGDGRSCRILFCPTVFLALAFLSFNAAQAQTTNYTLGTTNLLVGPTAGSSSVVLRVTPQTGDWIATANVSWLHLAQTNQSGMGNMNVIFSFDANPGLTRYGSLSIGDQTLTITQAGSNYVAAAEVTTLVSNGLHFPCGVVADLYGNVFIADTINGAIKEWKSGDNTVVELISSGLVNPIGMAVDGAGNVYIADPGNNTVKKWIAANSNVTDLVSSGLDEPYGVAVDLVGNVYIADTGNDAIKEWTVADSKVTTLVSSGLARPIGVAVDAQGNVYIGDYYYNVIDKWTRVADTLTTLVSGLVGNAGVAVDGAGNLYIANTGYNAYSGEGANSAIMKWTAANGTLSSIVSSGLNNPFGVAIDGAGNVYIADEYNNAVKELPNVFVAPTAKFYNCAVGNDVLPVVLPTNANLLPPFAPAVMPPSAESWLTITGTTNGIVGFSFTSNSGPNRAANISLLGQYNSVFQSSPPNFLNTGIPGNVQFSFSNFQNSSFTVLSSTNLFLPLTNWSQIGSVSNIGPYFFEFTDTNPPTDSQRFYRVRSP